ncbi:MAG: asparagine synthase-related protein [Xanthobacteraceae bacterium]
MSAIFGILRFDGRDASRRDLERMSNTLAHRGPDGCNFVVDGAIALGHCLMRVNREDVFETQPIRDRTADLTLVADLRLDNREELATAFGIGPEELRTIPDSALVLGAYKMWRENCAEHLLGDFAFAIWDGGARELFVGRDHMGQRSVHYYQGKDFFAFATEIKALWALGDVPRKISEAQLGKFLLADSRSREGASYFEDIWGVQGGSTVTIPARGPLLIRRYWEVHANAEHVGRDETYYVETYRRVFKEAVECRIRRLIASPALSLSGGYDSAAIAGLCSPILTAQRRKLIAVSSVLADGYQGPLPCARHWVEICERHMPHLDVRYVQRGEADVLTHLQRNFMVADGLLHLGHYITDRLFREASSAGARLIMNGIGGDSTINRRSGGTLALWLRSGEFRKFLSEFGPHCRMTGQTVWQSLRREVVLPFLPSWVRKAFAAARRGFATRWSTVPVAPAFVSSLSRDGAIDKDWIMSAWQDREGVRTRVLQALYTWPSSNRRWDTNEAASYGMDLTMPLMDKRVVEFGLAIPPKLEVNKGRERDLACRALGDVYPPEFQGRGRRQDWLVPDLVGMLESCRPALRAEVKRMKVSPTLSRVFDFDKMEKQLSQRPANRMETAEATRALRAFVTAKYVAWLIGDNR